MHAPSDHSGERTSNCQRSHGVSGQNILTPDHKPRTAIGHNTGLLACGQQVGTEFLTCEQEPAAINVIEETLHCALQDKMAMCFKTG